MMRATATADTTLREGGTGAVTLKLEVDPNAAATPAGVPPQPGAASSVPAAGA